MPYPLIMFLLCILVSVSANTSHAQTDAGRLFKKQCAACHGTDGSGNTELGRNLKPFPARDLRPTILSLAEIRRVLKQGSPKTGMHGREPQLSAAQIDAIAAYVRKLPYQSNVQRGRLTYMNKCARCHGGDGRRVTELGAPDLLVSEMSDEDMAKVIRYGHRGTIMGGMKRELGNAVIADMITWLRLRRYGLED